MATNYPVSQSVIGADRIPQKSTSCKAEETTTTTLVAVEKSHGPRGMEQQVQGGKVNAPSAAVWLCAG